MANARLASTLQGAYVDQAVEDFRKAIELKPDYAHAYNALGYTLADRTDRLDALIEVSGGVNEANFEDYLIEGVDVISIGALTHSPRAGDVAIEIKG